MSNLKKHNILLFGGGRWARQIIREIVTNFKNKYNIVVITPRNSIEMKKWIRLNNFSSVRVNKNIPKLKNNFFASIVANSVNDHYLSAIKSLKNKIPTLVEKPVTLSQSQTKKLIYEAKKNNVKLFTSNVFLFSHNIISFLDKIKKKSKIRLIKIYWKDPLKEIRYGEMKKSDLSIPIYADYLPHILPFIWKLTNQKNIKLTSHRFSKDENKVKFNFLANYIKCHITLDRAAIKRVRLIKIDSERSTFTFNFHTSKPKFNDRPLAKMLKTFFICAEKNINNHKLNIELSLKINQMMDQILYKKKLIK